MTFSPSVEIRRTGVNNTTLSVYPDGRVVLTVPQQASELYIERFLERKRKWLDKKISDLSSSTLAAAKAYVSGETFRYMGRQLRLQVTEENQENVKLSRGRLCLMVQDKNDLRKKQLLIKAFFSFKAKAVIAEMLSLVYEKFKPHLPEKPRLYVRALTRRWGSCSRKQWGILINRSLIHRPRSLIEYVVTHELCHLVHPRHDRHFYRLLTIMMPDWQERKNRLEETAHPDYDSMR